MTDIELHTIERDWYLIVLPKTQAGVDWLKAQWHLSDNWDIGTAEWGHLKEWQQIASDAEEDEDCEITFEYKSHSYGWEGYHKWTWRN